jgi:predicted transcriptional regulator
MNNILTLKEIKMTTVTTETKSSKLLATLKTGERLTEAQIRARFGLKNPRATVSALRFQGYAIYANPHKDTKGRQSTKYRLGTPSRAVIAAGYRALAEQA